MRTDYCRGVRFDLFRFTRLLFNFSLTFLRLAYDKRVLLVSVILFRFSRFNGVLVVSVFLPFSVFFFPFFSLFWVLGDIPNY